MKRAICKYIMVISVLALAVFMLAGWFGVDAGGTLEYEEYSFMTLPDMVGAGADIIAKLMGKTMAITMLVLTGVLKWFTMLASAFCVWGGIRSIMHGKRSRLITSAQIITAFLLVIAFIAIITVNMISGSLAGDAISLVPLWGMVVAAALLVISIVSGHFLVKFSSGDIYETDDDYAEDDYIEDGDAEEADIEADDIADDYPDDMYAAEDEYEYEEEYEYESGYAGDEALEYESGEAEEE